MTEAIVCVSGGQDSLTVLIHAMKRHEKVDAVCFYYGQKHRVELDCARSFCRDRGVSLTQLDLPFLNEVSSGLTSEEDVDFGTAHERLTHLPVSFVPARNALMLTMAHAVACERGAGFVYGGMCQTDYSGYPDCRQVFISSLEQALNVGYDANVEFVMPLMYLNKAETFAMAEELGCLDEIIEQSHTCYQGERKIRHGWGYGCGVCPACELRKKGFREFTEAAAEA